jgi:hypothetical protein
MALDIKGLTSSLVDLGFELAGQITVSVEYVHRTASVYDPATGEKTDSTETASVSAILASYREREIDGERIRVGDRRMTIKQKDLSGISAFDQQDTVTIAEERWQIIDPKLDPAEGDLQAQIRKIA